MLCRVSVALGKGLKTLGKDHTAKFQPAKQSLPSVIFRALGKDFATLGKDKNEKIQKDPK